jgi:hypothetical protein
MAAASSSYKATDAVPAAAQPTAAAEDSLFISTKPIAPIGTYSSVFLAYIFYGIYCVIKTNC